MCAGLAHCLAGVQDREEEEIVGGEGRGEGGRGALGHYLTNFI